MIAVELRWSERGALNGQFFFADVFLRVFKDFSLSRAAAALSAIVHLVDKSSKVLKIAENKTKKKTSAAEATRM